MSTSTDEIAARISALSAPVETQEPAQEAPQAAQQEAPQESQQEAPQEAQGESEQPEQAAPEVEEIEISDLNGLAEHLGVDPADLYNISVPYTQNGEKAEFTLGDLKDKYQRFQETESLRAEAQQRADAYREAQEQVDALHEAHRLHAQAIYQFMEQGLLQDFAGVNWDHLRVANPGEFIRLQQTFQNRQGQLHQMRQDVVRFVEEQDNASRQQKEHLRRQHLIREQDALFRALPSWRDQKAADPERAELSRYLADTGYKESYINEVDDHKFIVLARKAMMFDKMSTQGSVAAKKVVKLAKKIVTPGTRQTSAEQSTDQERSLRKNVRQSGSVQDAAALIQYRLGKKR